VKVIKDNYTGIKMREKSICGETDNFSIQIGVHLGSAESLQILLYYEWDYERYTEWGVLWYIMCRVLQRLGRIE